MGYYGLFPHLNVWENVAFGLKRRKVARAQVKTRVAEGPHATQPRWDSAKPAEPIPSVCLDKHPTSVYSDNHGH